MARFVLIHGTGAGGWVWEKVARLLRGEGHEVYTPTLSGVSDPELLLGCGVELRRSVEQVTKLLIDEDLHDVVLVGHNNGGRVITEVAAKAPCRLRLLVYLDAVIPFQDPEGGLAAGLPPPSRAEGESVTALAAHSPDRRPARAEAARPGMPTWAQEESCGYAVHHGVPCAYIHCTKAAWLSVFGRFAKAARARGWTVREILAEHFAMTSEPALVARALLELSGEAAPTKKAVRRRWQRRAVPPRARPGREASG
jgi:pimeloyl-ACP methyl ester carboxylesterase